VALKNPRLVSFCNPANENVTPRKARRTSNEPPGAPSVDRKRDGEIAFDAGPGCPFSLPTRPWLASDGDEERTGYAGRTRLFAITVLALLAGNRDTTTRS